MKERIKGCVLKVAATWNWTLFMPKKEILVIEDEKDLFELIKYNLEKEGFNVFHASDGEEGLRLVQRKHPALVLLDLMLPVIDGLEVCRRIKKDQQTASIPVVILTVKDAESDIVSGLEVGADDYITKPFSPRVLLARVKAILRRYEESTEVRKVIRIADLTIDSVRHEVKINGEDVQLTRMEFDLLKFLAGRAGRVLTRNQIMDGILGEDAVIIDRAIDVHIASLRKKLGEYGSRIVTVRGVGYKFKEP
ncbi:MAG TPA: response regulator transcription factor [Candidatus Hypogeohydataceae bacterium YC41]